MNANSEKSAEPGKPDDAVPATPSRAEAYRERFRQSQAIAAQVARARAAGGQPSESEAARLVAEFHARGGKVTVCPQPEETPPTDSGRGGRNGRG
ncbi:hypothetical protein [Roseomonas sp. AR75]|uniref:hypothetical protein n=1 Tax=Roseomonas sp. AR75 TaxID=2562311 RepID=UPI0010C04723|nr:hypothetical protein [Roseomonas sp. AR75]